MHEMQQTVNNVDRACDALLEIDADARLRRMENKILTLSTMMEGRFEAIQAMLRSALA